VRLFRVVVVVAADAAVVADGFAAVSSFFGIFGTLLLLLRLASFS